MITPKWSIRLSGEAENDLRLLFIAVYKRLEISSANTYIGNIIEILSQLENGPEMRGSLDRDEVMVGLKSVHSARDDCPGWHCILYRVVAPLVIAIVRVLDDTTDRSLGKVSV